MNINRQFKKVLRAIAAFACSGMLFALSCSSEDLRNLPGQLEIIASDIDGAENISLRDFLLAQFEG